MPGSARSRRVERPTSESISQLDEFATGLSARRSWAFTLALSPDFCAAFDFSSPISYLPFIAPEAVSIFQMDAASADAPGGAQPRRFPERVMPPVATLLLGRAMRVLLIAALASIAIAAAGPEGLAAESD